MLAQAGLGSRRELEQLIRQGRLSVDGQVATLGDRIDGSERLKIDGKIVRLRSGPVHHSHLIYHKPVGEICTRSDPEDRPTVFASLPRPAQGRWVLVGRLDINSCGLVLLSTDGELANALMHPRLEIEREYAVRVLGEPKAADLDRLRDGVLLDDGPARFEKLELNGGSGANQWYRVSLREGRKREVRRLWNAIGIKVSRLIRTRFGPIELEKSLERGRSRLLNDNEIEMLYRAVGMRAPKQAVSGRRPAKRRARRG